MIAPTQIIHEQDVLPALRELSSRYPAMKQSGAETLSRALFVLCFLSYRPDTFAVDVARAALLREDEVLS